MSSRTHDQSRECNAGEEMRETAPRLIHRGCSYYPPHHDPGDWDRDFKGMADAGFNAIRTAELLASWDRIERFPRRPDFEWLDRTFELGERYGLRILLGTGACCPPIWMLDEYPDLQIVTRDGVPYPTGATWHWACIDHPALVAESDRYLHQLIERYAHHGALLGWQVDNEPGHPFMARRGVVPDWYCYCPHSAGKFRRWLEAKYSRIEALNDAWRWDPTHHQYSTWIQIRPPRATPAEWGVITAWLDWRTYWAENWTAFVRHQAGLIRARDPGHLVVTNLLDAGDFNNRLGVDRWTMAAAVDVIGYDLYPGLRKHPAPERGRTAGGPAYVSWFLDLGRSTALHAGKPLWVTEMESGPLDGWVKGPRYTTTALDIKRWYLEALGHGAKAILYQGYREWNCIPIHWGALVDLHGERTERYDAAACVNAVVRKHEALFAEAQPVRSHIGLLFGHDNAVLTASLAADDFNGQALLGLYEALWAAHCPPEMISPEHLDGIPYRVLFLPYAMLISGSTAQRLKDYVESGGTLVGFAKCAMLDDRGWYWNTRPGAGLDEVFGVRERSIEYRPEPFTVSLTVAGMTLDVSGYHHQQLLDVAPGAEIFGRFADGSPAAVRHRVGRGQALYFATHLDIAAFGSPAHHQVFKLLLRDLGVEPRVVIHGDGIVDPHLLAGPANEHLLILTNDGARPAEVTATVASIRATAVDELFGLPVQVQPAEGLAVQVRVPAHDAAALRIR
jgi:beta-galactosidase